MPELELILRCGECGAVEHPKILLRWAPDGVLEMVASTHFYVDGASVRCRAHADPEKDRRQRWSRQLQRELEPSCA